MAGAIQLTEVDFQQIKENLVNYLKSTKQFTDYDFDGSNLQVILNLLSYQAQMNAYTANMVANESFLTSATLRNNVVAAARMLGYMPTSARSAVATIDFDFQLDVDDYPGGFPKYLELSPGIAFSAGTGLGSFIFNTIDVHVAPVDFDGSCHFKQIRVYEGVFLPAKFVVDSSNFTQRFILENPKIDTSTIRIEVQENPDLQVSKFYSKAESIVHINEESRVYWLEEDDDQHYELTFGDGLFGYKLPNGAIINITYVVSNGELGNGIQGTENFIFEGTIIDSFGTTLGLDATVVSVDPSNGGSEIESVSSVKFRAPKHYGTQSRCVTTNDYETIIRQVYPAIQGIYVYGGETLPIPQYGRVYIAIKPLLGDTLSNITKDFIRRSLEEYRVASIDIVIQDPTVMYGEVVSTVFYNELKTVLDTSSIVSGVNNVLSAYASSLNVSKFGGALKYSKIVAAIDDSNEAITRNNTHLRMRKDIKAAVNQDATYEICFENELKIDANQAVVYSTWFNLSRDGVVDLNTRYQIEDDPNTTRAFDYDSVLYTELTDPQKQTVKSLLPLGIQGKTIPERVWVHQETKEILLTLPLGKLRLFHFNNLNQKIIDDPNIGSVNYDTGELLIGYETGKQLNVVDTQVGDGVIEMRANPRSLDIIAKNSVYLQMDVAKSSISAVADRNIIKQ